MMLRVESKLADGFKSFDDMTKRKIARSMTSAAAYTRGVVKKSIGYRPLDVYAPPGKVPHAHHTGTDAKGYKPHFLFSQAKPDTLENLMGTANISNPYIMQLQEFGGSQYVFAPTDFKRFKHGVKIGEEAWVTWKFLRVDDDHIPHGSKSEKWLYGHGRQGGISPRNPLTNKHKEYNPNTEKDKLFLMRITNKIEAEHATKLYRKIEIKRNRHKLATYPPRPFLRPGLNRAKEKILSMFNGIADKIRVEDIKFELSQNTL